MQYLADSILVVVDCSEISKRGVEDLFMNSRDRLREGPLLHSIEAELSDILKNHGGLRLLRTLRAQRDIKDRLADNKPLKDTLSKIINEQPTLASLLLHGIDISSPIDLTGANSAQTIYNGKSNPTFFKLVKSYTQDNPKRSPINRKMRVEYETDADNLYFDREVSPGEMVLTSNGNPISDFSANLWNGKLTLNISMPSSVAPGDKLHFRSTIIDQFRAEPFIDTFHCLVTERVESSTSISKPSNPPGDQEGDDRMRQSSLAMPEMNPIHKDRWDEFGFGPDSGMKVKDISGEGSYVFFINVDNKYLLQEMKQNKHLDSEIFQSQYMYALTIIGMTLLRSLDKDRKIEFNQDEGTSIFESIDATSDAISAVIVPLINSLGKLIT